MTTRRITHDDAAGAAALVQFARSRKEDLIDPFPPASEMEVLVDMGSRQDDNAKTIVAVEGDLVVGLGAIDFSSEMRRATLVGPVVDSAHRRKGIGTSVLDELLANARAARQKYVRSAVGADNEAGQTVLRQAGFKYKETHTCVRLNRPKTAPMFTLDGIVLERMEAEDDERYHAFTSKFVARLARQTRSLLKSDDYTAVLATKAGRPVGCVEVDLRFGNVASIENLDAPPSLLHKGLGNALVGEAMRAAFERDSTTAIDILLAGADEERIDGMRAMGFDVRHQLTAFELRL